MMTYCSSNIISKRTKVLMSPISAVKINDNTYIVVYVKCSYQLTSAFCSLAYNCTAAVSVGDSCELNVVSASSCFHLFGQHSNLINMWVHNLNENHPSLYVHMNSRVYHPAVVTIDLEVFVVRIFQWFVRTMKINTKYILQQIIIIIDVP